MEMVIGKIKKVFSQIIDFSYIKYISFFTVVLFYCFSLPVRNSSFLCLAKNSDISRVCGIVRSNPNICKSTKYYQCEFEPQSVFTKKNEVTKFSSKGKINLLIPVEEIESHYPGKLFSITKNNFIVENGANLSVELTSIANEQDNLFIANKITFISWKNTFSKMRGLLRIQFKRLMFLWGDTGALLLALLSGSKEALNSNLALAFQFAGLSHILALSGMHVSIFSNLTNKTFYRILGNNLTQIVTVFIVLLFVLFAGFSPSLLRALINIILLFLIKKFCIPISMIDCLCLSYVLQIIIRPTDSCVISFMLSYLALFGILTIGSVIKKFFIPYLGVRFSSDLASSIGAIICTCPISIKMWGFITPIGIVSTLIISPLISIFLSIGILFILLALIFPFLTYPLGLFLQILYYFIEKFVIFFSNFQPIYF